MNDSLSFDGYEIAQSIKGRKPPYSCPACNKSYKSATGFLYHIGQFVGRMTTAPRCMLSEDTPGGSPRPGSCPGSPGGTLRRKQARRELTWAEAQRLVEIEFDNSVRRIEIDRELDLSLHSEDEADGSCTRGQTTDTPHSLQKKGRGSKGETPSCLSKSKNKGKRKTRLKGGKNDGIVPLPKVDVTVIEAIDSENAPARESSYFRFVAQTAEDLDEMIEYDIDEEDSHWLSLVNEERRGQGSSSVPQEVFELIMDRLEKECCFASQSLQDGSESLKNMYNIDENAVCCICNDGECHNTNAILFCDMCNLAVHQECYGVPYIPEGQWLCRRCLQSPSRSVNCALCPHKGGAFKQTINGRWAHVICAIWIPEVQFSNPVFLEPIDGIKDIPTARWKLTCYICRRRMGACIQCAKPNCYVAFHVTCAQHASLHMKVSIAKNGEVQNLAYCDSHTPPSIKKKLEKAKLERGSSSSGSDTEVTAAATEMVDVFDTEIKESKAVKKARKKIQERRLSTTPIVNIPYIPQHRLDRIVSQTNVAKKTQFIPRLVNYWKLKRQSRNGVPLLRRLQASKGQRPAVNLTDEEREMLTEQLSLWKNLRHDLERTRMLVELVRKREKLKREQLKFQLMISDLQLRPVAVVMRKALDRLARKDPADIFAEPVPVDDVPDYLDIIKHPMDFSTMRRKVSDNEYGSFESFEEDFYHVWHNATVYNQPDTVYYKAAIRIRDAGKSILEKARVQLTSAGVNLATGLHDPEVQEPPPLTPSTHQAVDLLSDNDDVPANLKARSRHFSTTSLSLEEQAEILQEQLELVQAGCSGSAKKTKVKNIKRELQVVRRKQKRERNYDLIEPRRRRAPSVSRNAEELADHLIHGSLRMTASRQQILSHSGIKLEERATALQQQEPQEKEEPEQSTEEKMVIENDVFESAAELSSEEEAEVNDGQSSSDYEPSRSVSRKLSKSSRRVEPSPVKTAAVSDSETYLLKTRSSTRQNGSRSWSCVDQDARKSSPYNTRRQRRNSSGVYVTSASEIEGEITMTNGFNSTPPYVKPAEHIITRVLRSRGRSNSSSQYETGEGYSSEDKISDRHFLSSIPSASSLDDLTTVAKKRKVLNRKRKSIFRVGGEKKVRLTSESSDAGSVGPPVNGLTPNGAQRDIQYLDVVWAKCRGYPSYPALVIDPAIPKKGLSVYGEKIQAPSDEVLGLRTTHPEPAYLVRFFDGRRSWQWLPPDKISPLGVNSDCDQKSLTHSGSSKRSVKEAYMRAKMFLSRASCDQPTQELDSELSESEQD